MHGLKDTSNPEKKRWYQLDVYTRTTMRDIEFRNCEVLEGGVWVRCMAEIDHTLGTHITAFHGGDINEVYRERPVAEEQPKEMIKC